MNIKRPCQQKCRLLYLIQGLKINPAKFSPMILFIRSLDTCLVDTWSPIVPWIGHGCIGVMRHSPKHMRTITPIIFSMLSSTISHLYEYMRDDRMNILHCHQPSICAWINNFSYVFVYTGIYDENHFWNGPAGRPCSFSILFIRIGVFIDVDCNVPYRTNLAFPLIIVFHILPHTIVHVTFNLLYFVVIL